jgi:hypothetical protein
MVLRYGFGVVLGLVTTFVLFMIMQSVIRSDRNPFTEGFQGKIVDIVRLDEDLEIEIKKRKPPKPPPPDEPPPDMPKPELVDSAPTASIYPSSRLPPSTRGVPRPAASKATCCSSSSSPRPGPWPIR